MEHIRSVKDHTETGHRGKPARGIQFVSISAGCDGMPQVDTEAIRLKAGDTLKFVGDVEFSIRFPDDSPRCDKLLKSRRRAVSIKIPETICTCGDGTEKTRRYKYDVIIGDRVLDPEIVIEPR